MFYSTDVTNAQEQFSKYSFFEYCWVGDDTATYTVEILPAGENHISNGHRVDYFKTVNILTGEVLRAGSTLHIFKDGELLKALDAHYGATYIREDGITQAIEQLEMLDNIEMPRSAMFGKCVFYSDVDELHVTDSDGVFHCFS
jgi:hypothetical protein